MNRKQPGLRPRRFAAVSQHLRAVGFEAAHETVEDMILDEVEQLVFGVDVVIEPGHADVRPVGHHADGGGVEAHLGKDRRGRAQDLHQLAVVFRGLLTSRCGFGGLGPGRLPQLLTGHAGLLWSWVGSSHGTSSIP